MTWKTVKRVPIWATALVLAVSVVLLAHFGWIGYWSARYLYIFCLVLPGLVMSPGKRTVLIASALTASLALFAHFELSSKMPQIYPLGRLLDTVTVLTVLGVFQWWLACRDRPRSLFGILLFAVGISCVVVLVVEPLRLAELKFAAPGLYGSRDVDVGQMTFVLGLPVIAWASIPALIRGLATGDSRRCLQLLGACSLSCGTALVAFWGPGLRVLGKWSFAGKGPFSREMGAWILHVRHHREDVEFIWGQLQHGDWKSPPRDTEFHPERDWRNWGVWILTQHDSADTATRLSELLRERPTYYLARYSAELLAKHKHAECIPLLFRYALRGSTDCEHALEEFAFKPAAGLILRKTFSPSRIRDVYPSRDFTLPEREHQELVSLWGHDIGRSYVAWVESLRNELEIGLSSAAPTSPNDEWKFELVCYRKYHQAKAQLDYGASVLALQRLANSNQQWAVTEWSKAIKDPSLLMNSKSLPPKVKEAIELISRYQEEANNSIHVAEPDWDQANSQVLEREIEGFASRVDSWLTNTFDKATIDAMKSEMSNRQLIDPLL